MKTAYVITVGDTFVGATLLSRGGVVEIGRRERLSGTPLRESITPLFLDQRLRPCRRVAVELTGRVVQLRTLRDLPPTTDLNLARMVRIQADRYFRKCEGTPVVAATALLLDDGRTVVRAACAGAAYVDEVECTLEEIGVEAVSVRAVDAELEAELILETERHRSRARETLRRTVGIYFTLAALAWTIAGGVYLVDLKRDVAAVRAEMASLAAPIAQLRRVREDIAEVAVEVRAIEAAGLERRWATDGLARLSREIPSTAHLTRLEIRSNEAVRVEGRAVDALTVLAALSSHGPTRLDAPLEVEQFGGTDWQRFTLTTGSQDDVR